MPTLRKDPQSEAAAEAARARLAIAKQVAALAPNVQEDADAQVILHLAEAYANLAAEPPRARAE
jgi:hypothetical protein